MAERSEATKLNYIDGYVDTCISASPLSRLHTCCDVMMSYAYREFANRIGEEGRGSGATS